MEKSKSLTTQKSNTHHWPLYIACFLLAFVLLLSLNTSLFSNTYSFTLFSTSANSYTLQPHSSSSPPPPQQSPAGKPDPCRDRYVHILDLPTKFNTDILRDCKSLCKWFDMCPFLPNNGLGPRVNGTRGPSWYVTNQFSLELVFHNRMKKYECLTNDTSLASLVYVPYYAGLDLGRYLWTANASVRDELSLDMVKRVGQGPWWRTMSGHDHFLVVGRVGWDFSREVEDWGNRLELLPETKNMTVLILEALPGSVDIGIPYPTYFHPSHDSEVFRWQDTPPGDSLTRKSTFDSILAGCIPVLFHPGSAYVQYKWHLPEDYTKYSVFIPESEIKEGKTNIEEVLLGIPEERVAAMRAEVVRLIPKVTYAVSKLETVEDAFDVAIDGLLRKVKDAREQLLEIENSQVYP